MRAIRQWLSSAVLVVGTSAGFGQSPAPLPGPLSAPPPIAIALPPGSAFGGTVVGASSATPTSATPVAAAPLVAPAPGGPWASVPATCCGPIGGDGPVGQEVYVRTGPSIPFGKGVLADALNAGWNVTLGGRSLFFNQTGSAAWTIDAHLAYTLNNAGGQQLAFLNNAVFTVRNLHRTAIGLGGGRDWFLSAPGFVGGTWDANFRFGVDAGARWGTGHVDLNPVGDPTGYRRHHDVFGQSFAGVHADVNVPVGGWTFVLGGRFEWDYTFSDLLPTAGNFHDINLLLTVGVRY